MFTLMHAQNHTIPCQPPRTTYIPHTYHSHTTYHNTHQGNWGNALLEHGQVKRRLLAEVEAAAGALADAEEDPRAAAAIAAADASLRAEAEGLLLAAGKRFRGVLEIRGEDVRALTYWGMLCLGVKQFGVKTKYV